MKRISLSQWIKEHRAELDAYVSDIAPGWAKSDSARREWVLNDEWLYNWARSEGVAI